MSRFNAPGMAGYPSNNVYTGLALVSMFVTLIALIWVVITMFDLKVL